MDYYIDEKGRRFEVNPHTGERSKTPLAETPVETGIVSDPVEIADKTED